MAEETQEEKAPDKFFLVEAISQHRIYYLVKAQSLTEQRALNILTTLEDFQQVWDGEKISYVREITVDKAVEKLMEAGRGPDVVNVIDEVIDFDI